jgi:UDPglucose 6-dehydrogenase/UDP-N-acetyl-D-galactosamine dehydrogenase
MTERKPGKSSGLSSGRQKAKAARPQGALKTKAAKSMIDKATVCVVGLGYVGLPLALAFAGKLKVIGYDINKKRVAELKKDNRRPSISFTDDMAEISQADFIVICVPTPVTPSKEPDLTPVESAAAAVGKNMKRGSTVILESTVYPGVTEDIVRPILEAESGMKCGRDFKIGYAPERVNPGDDEHSIEKICKVVSGMDEETTGIVAELYSRVTPKIFKAKDIKTAEAAKVIENIQRDLNIALMNELSLIFEKLNLDTKEVLDAASTKWNFHRYTPGLVGGHCIPVDPYYLVYKARMLGYHSQVILAGRAINDSMAKHVADMTVRSLNDAGKVIRNSRALVMGLTYKENVPDTRETPVVEMLKELKEYGVETIGYDPVLDKTGAEKEFGIKILDNLKNAKNFDVIILTVPHDAFKGKNKGIDVKKLRSLTGDRPVLIDIKRCVDPDKARKHGFYYKTL